MCRTHARWARMEVAYTLRKQRNREKRARTSVDRAPLIPGPDPPRDFGAAIGYVCAASSGPCRVTECRLHLGADGCAVRVANAGEHTLEETARHLAGDTYRGKPVTRERLRQIEEKAKRKITRASRLPWPTAAAALRGFAVE